LSGPSTASQATKTKGGESRNTFAEGDKKPGIISRAIVIFTSNKHIAPKGKIHLERETLLPSCTYLSWIIEARRKATDIPQGAVLTPWTTSKPCLKAAHLG